MKFCSKLSFLEAFLLVQFLGKNTCISIIITYYGIYLTSTHDSSSHSKFKLFFRQYETKLIKFSDQRLKIVLNIYPFCEISHIESRVVRGYQSHYAGIQLITPNWFELGGSQIYWTRSILSSTFPNWSRDSNFNEFCTKNF